MSKDDLLDEYEKKYMRPAWIEVDLDNLSYNIKCIKNYVKGYSSNTRLIAVVKGNAYGHTAKEVIWNIIESGADMLATGILEEAVALREMGVKHEILVLGYTLPYQAPLIVENDIIQNVCTLELAEALSASAVESGKIVKVHIKIDTGLGRLGVLPEDALEFAQEVVKLPNIQIHGIYTHLATAHTGDPTCCRMQVSRFIDTVRELEDHNIETGIKHVANSSATMLSPAFYFDAVRCGCLMSGVYSSTTVPKVLDLKPSLSVHTRIVFMKKVPVGFSVGYGGVFVTDRESVIGILPLGHADGFSKGFFNKVDVLVNGKRVPVKGGINMDSCFVDLTDVPEVRTGDHVVIIGRQTEDKITALDLAGKLHGDTGEILDSFGCSRLPHVYLHEGKLR
jgi:alanine racemase